MNLPRLRGILRSVLERANLPAAVAARGEIIRRLECRRATRAARAVLTSSLRTLSVD